MVKPKKTKYDLQNTTQKTKDRATRISKLAAVRNFTYFIESTRVLKMSTGLSDAVRQRTDITLGTRKKGKKINNGRGNTTKKTGVERGRGCSTQVIREDKLPNHLKQHTSSTYIRI
jgi:hypothetical protein